MSALPAVVGGIASLALPWLAGALIALRLVRRSPRAPWLAIGYGYLLGAILTAWLMRLASAAGVPWHWAPLGAGLAAIAVLARWRGPRGLAWRSLDQADARARLVFGIAFVLLAARLATIAAEALVRPPLPFDAWTQWADKARVWYEHGRIVPFVPWTTWLFDAPVGAFTDPHPAYPPAIPLLQAWTSLWLGGWDEAGANLPWIGLGISLAVAFYARVRELGTAPALAMLGTYLLVSLPFLDIHLALAGVADIFVATAYFLAIAAFWTWCRTRDSRDAALAVLSAAAGAMLKVEGLFWATTLVPAAVVALRPRLGLALFGVGAAAVIAFLLLGSGELPLYGYVLRTRFADVSGPVLQHLFLMDNWHLFWYLLVGVVALRARAVFAPRIAPLSIAVLGAVGVIIVVFFFSSAAGGIADESLVNRFVLQVVPAFAFYLVVLLRECVPRRGAVASSGEAPRVDQHHANTAAL